MDEEINDIYMKVEANVNDLIASSMLLRSHLAVIRYQMYKDKDILPTTMLDLKGYVDEVDLDVKWLKKKAHEFMDEVLCGKCKYSIDGHRNCSSICDCDSCEKYCKFSEKDKGESNE